MSSISHLNTDANNHADEKHADENASGMLVEHSEPTTPADLGPHDAPPTDIVQVKMTHGNKTVNHFFQGMPNKRATTTKLGGLGNGFWFVG